MARRHHPLQYSTTWSREEFTTTTVNHEHTHTRTIPPHPVNQQVQHYNGTDPQQHGCNRFHACTHARCATTGPGQTSYSRQLDDSAVNTNHTSTVSSTDTVSSPVPVRGPILVNNARPGHAQQSHRHTNRNLCTPLATSCVETTSSSPHHAAGSTSNLMGTYYPSLATASTRRQSATTLSGTSPSSDRHGSSRSNANPSSAPHRSAQASSPHHTIMRLVSEMRNRTGNGLGPTVLFSFWI